MVITSLRQHIEMTPGVAGGKPRIAGRRITVQIVVVRHERMGKSVDEIATEHDLTLADVHAALAFSFDNRAAIDASIERDRELALSMPPQGTSIGQVVQSLLLIYEVLDGDEMLGNIEFI